MKRQHLTDEQSIFYCEGRLSADERETVEAHLAECCECRRDVEMMQAAMTTFERGESEDLPPLPHKLVDAAVAHARAQFVPLLAQLNAALGAQLRQLREQFKPDVVPPVHRAAAVGIAKDRNALSILPTTFELPEFRLTVHLSLSENDATLVLEGEWESLRGAQVIGFVPDDSGIARRRVLGTIDDAGTVTIPASDVFALERLELVNESIGQ
jgi:hypothetical protein